MPNNWVTSLALSEENGTLFIGQECLLLPCLCSGEHKLQMARVTYRGEVQLTEGGRINRIVLLGLKNVLTNSQMPAKLTEKKMGGISHD